ncbi:MAG TPA: hypothetical protein VMU50_17305 [Polyangia bacterium]|nr:hypothetical protein [Polyangia bacterium]
MLLACCATPSRQLSTRAVDDPIVLPARMTSVSVTSSAWQYQSSADGPSYNVLPALRWGLTNRLEWDVTSFGYAFLDDAPSSPGGQAPLSLAAHAGSSGVAASSTDGLVLFPTASVDLIKHLDPRWLLSGGMAWDARWSRTPVIATDGVNARLEPTGSRWADLSAYISVLRQLNGNLALGASFSADEYTDCLSPLCEQLSRGVGASLRLVYRPLPWLSFALVPRAGLRARPSALRMPVAPADPVDMPPETASWFGCRAAVAFYY